MSMNLSRPQFLVLSQVIIFVLGWPLEWTEIIVIFMPIFIPLLDNFGVDPLFFGLLVALNLQTAFLSPPVAMAAFYLKGVSPPHVTLNQIFAGMLPFMGIQVVAIVLLYHVPRHRPVAAASAATRAAMSSTSSTWWTCSSSRGGAHIQVFGGGGGVIVPPEIRELQAYGVTRIYSPEDGQRMGLAGMIGEMVMRCDKDLTSYAPKTSRRSRAMAR
jgi:hypothetical protein